MTSRNRPTIGADSLVTCDRHLTKSSGDLPEPLNRRRFETVSAIGCHRLVRVYSTLKNPYPYDSSNPEQTSFVEFFVFSPR